MDRLRVLIVGSGGREHALAWRLAGEPDVETVIVAPGNPGMTDVARTAPDIDPLDGDAVAGLASAERIGLVVVGPEAPLVAGLADRLAAAGIPVFGPSAAAARLEGSKAFCREVAEAAGVRMAEGRAFTATAPAIRFAARFGGRVAVKADGLAAGKGVVMCATEAAAEAAIRAALEDGAFGDAGRTVVVEEALEGPELSVIALCDESACLALPGARDHKRLGDGDEGPNTGGMGALSPAPGTDDALAGRIVETVHRPVLAELARRGLPFRGALFAGLILTADGPRLLEFNVRFGDPETQAIVPRLEVPLGRLLAAAARGGLAAEAGALGIAGALLPVRTGAAASVVLAAAGYPGSVRTGDPIAGIDAARASGTRVFAAGVAGAPGALTTRGGRVLAVVGEGRTIEEAAAAAYRGADAISFAGMQLRRDLGRAPVATGARA